jgi:hypothetical protein
MADLFELGDVSSEDTGKGKEKKTGGNRSYNMPKGGKLSYKSLAECLKTAKSSSDSTACKQYFDKKTSPKKKRLGESEMDSTQQKIWRDYIEKGSISRFYNSPEENAQLDSIIESRVKKLDK